jgi:hypothetical protein
MSRWSIKDIKEGDIIAFKDERNPMLFAQVERASPSRIQYFTLKSSTGYVGAGSFPDHSYEWEYVLRLQKGMPGWKAAYTQNYSMDIRVERRAFMELVFS